MEMTNKDIEVMEERQLEPMPDAGGIVPSATKEQINDIVEFAANVDRFIQAQNKIRIAILKLTHPSDWTLFGTGDKKTAEIGFAPANRIGSTMGVSYTNWSAEKISEVDEKGSWYRWEFQADAIWRGRSIRVYGRAGSRDKLFGKKDGEFKQLYDVNEGDIKVSAMRACKKEGVKDLFGLHHLDPKILKENGIDLNSAGGYSFQSKEKQADETNAVQDEVLSAEVAKEGETNGKKWKLHKVIVGDGTEFFSWKDEYYQVALKAKATKNLVRISFKVTEKGGKEITSITKTDQIVEEKKGEPRF